MEATQIQQCLREAEEAAYEAADNYFKTQLGGVDQFACGFAWVNIFEHNGKKISGNTKLGRAMKAAGIRQNWQRVFEVWNPSGYRCQNVDTLEAGAQAAALVFRKYGFTAYAGSRLD